MYKYHPNILIMQTFRLPRHFSVLKNKISTIGSRLFRASITLYYFLSHKQQYCRQFRGIHCFFIKYFILYTNECVALSFPYPFLYGGVVVYNNILIMSPHTVPPPPTPDWSEINCGVDHTWSVIMAGVPLPVIANNNYTVHQYNKYTAEEFSFSFCVGYSNHAWILPKQLN